jgi:hypothetical protein
MAWVAWKIVGIGVLPLEFCSGARGSDKRHLPGLTQDF